MGGGDLKGMADRVKRKSMTVECSFHKEGKPRRWVCVFIRKTGRSADILFVNVVSNETK